MHEQDIVDAAATSHSTGTADPEAIFSEIPADTPVGASALPADAPHPSAGERGIDAMLGVSMTVQVILGHSRLQISELLALGRGSLVELDRRIGEPVDVVVNDRLVARGDLVKLDGNRVGVKLAEIVKDHTA